MSPEQIAGKKVDGRSDLYSLGVMLFQMLTGVLPFRGDSMAELMYKIANEEAPDIRVIRKDVPERLAHVVALSLAKKPELRYQDGDQFAGDLKNVLAQLSGSAATEPAAAAPAATSFAPAATAEKTQAFSLDAASQAQAAAEKTLVLAAAALPAAPGYDAPQSPAAGGAAYEKTAVFSPPDVPGGKADPKA
jgi:serine/threonine-protein kinase